MIDCRQCREDLAEYALGHISGARRDAIAGHVVSCPGCRQELAEAEAAWALLPLTLPSQTLPPAIFERVMDRIAGRPAAGDLSRAGKLLSRRERILSYVVAASVLVALSAAYFSLARPSGEEAAAQRAVEKLAERLGSLQQMEQLLQSNHVRLVSLHQPESPAREQAYVVWDLATGQWHFFATNLQPAGPRRAYQLWAAQSDGTLKPGPLFVVDENGLGSVVADFQGLNSAVAAKAIVTLEPAGGSKTPTGKVILEAAL
jgi:anti-sigma-K factor RskA